MLIDLIGVKPDPSMPNQYFEITIGTATALPEICEVAIERPGQDRPYLASGGWQANYVRLEVVLRQDDTPHRGLRLAQDLLRFFESGYNYKVSLFALQGGGLGFFVIGWDPSRELLTLQSLPAQPIVLEPIQDLEAGLLVRPEPKAILDQELEVVLNEQPKSMPILDRQRVVIRCEECCGEIFSTFTACPYCGATVTTEDHR